MSHTSVTRVYVNLEPAVEVSGSHASMHAPRRMHILIDAACLAAADGARLCACCAKRQDDAHIMMPHVDAGEKVRARRLAVSARRDLTTSRERHIRYNHISAV